MTTVGALGRDPFQARRDAVIVAFRLSTELAASMQSAVIGASHRDPEYVGDLVEARALLTELEDALRVDAVWYVRELMSVRHLAFQVTLAIRDAPAAIGPAEREREVRLASLECAAGAARMLMATLDARAHAAGGPPA